MNVTVNQVQAENEWMGTDFYHSNIPGLTVFGSYLTSDSDKGSIVLRLNRGDRLLYRSGPTGGRQLAQVKGDYELINILPVALEWMLLEFSSDRLPDTFEIEFIDNGDSWGEWSAISLLLKEVNE